MSRNYVFHEAIQMRPGMYVGPNLLRGIINACYEDICLCGAGDFTILREGAYVVVTADVDWMITDIDPVEMLFQRALCEIDDRRSVSHWRAEAFVAALAAAYFSDGPAGQSSSNMSFNDIPMRYRDHIAGKVRFLIFNIHSRYFANER